jgi:hypothetical protein
MKHPTPVGQHRAKDTCRKVRLTNLGTKPKPYKAENNHNRDYREQNHILLAE